MKKTLLALAIAATATSVNAAEIYSNDDTKVGLKGEVDIYLTQSEADTYKYDKDTDTESISKEKKEADVSTWAKIQLDAEQKLNDQFTAYASFEIEADDGNAKFDDIWVGFKTDTWGMAFGETGDLAESADAIQKDDITNEGNYMGSTGGHHRESKGHGVVFKGEFVEGLTLVADVNTTSEEDVDNTYGISADYAFSNFSLGTSYITGDAEKDIDYSLAGVSASAEFGGLYLALTYAQFEGANEFGYWELKDKDSSVYMNGNTMGVAVAYQMDKVRLYTTYAIANLDELATATGTSKLANDVDVDNLVFGVDYAFRDNILFLAEYQTATMDFNTAGEKDWDADTVTAGVYYTF